LQGFPFKIAPCEHIQRRKKKYGLNSGKKSLAENGHIFNNGQMDKQRRHKRKYWFLLRMFIQGYLKNETSRRIVILKITGEKN